MTVTDSATSERSVIGERRRDSWISARGAVVLSALLALLLFLSTLQLVINGSEDRYATDVGEIQNALPRWGTIHFTGYPQYTALGSLFVNALRLGGVSPAAGASLFSAVWGVAAAALLTALILSFNVPPWAALLSSLLFTMSTSMWIDGSIAELHTMTMALTFAALWLALRFHRHGRTTDLYWLVFVCSQGITHQRAFAFMAPALALLVLPRWRMVLQKILPVLALALTGPITYLYLPLVDWLGSDWVFSAPGTWQGFWALVLDTKAERIVSVPGTMQALRERLQAVLGLLNDDWPAPLWISGLLGLAIAWRGSRGEQGEKAPPDQASGHRAPTNVERIALLVTALVYLVLSLVIWEGFVSDALLAVKLPVIAMAAVGLAFIAARVAQRSPAAARLSMLVFAVLVAILFAINRPQVLRITRDQGAEQTIALVRQVQPAADGRPITFMALWGNDFWQLAYAQAYEGRFEHLNLVDHNANFNELLARGDHLYTLERTFLTRSLADWEERLGEVQLSSVYPGIVEIRGAEQGESLSGTTSGEDLLAMANGIAIHEATLRWKDMGVIEVEVVWHALEKPELDYSVAVHLVSADPPAGPEHLLAQADRIHPVGGWYPTSQWHAGEFVTDHYLLPVPAEAQPVAVRVGMYRVLGDGTFENSEVLSLPLPERPEGQATQDE